MLINIRFKITKPATGISGKKRAFSQTTCDLEISAVAESSTWPL